MIAIALYKPTVLCGNRTEQEFPISDYPVQWAQWIHCLWLLRLFRPCIHYYSLLCTDEVCGEEK